MVSNRGKGVFSKVIFYLLTSNDKNFRKGGKIMKKEELFRKIREAEEEEAKEIFENMLQGVLRGAVVAIMARNFSHNAGPHMKIYKEK